MNETINQSIINNIDLSKSVHYLSFLSKTLTSKIVEYLSNKGIFVSSRWVSALLLFVSFLIIYVGMKITKPIIKTILIILGGLLLVGILVPW